MAGADPPKVEVHQGGGGGGALRATLASPKTGQAWWGASTARRGQTRCLQGPGPGGSPHAPRRMRSPVGPT